ncbi:hypothetical protein A9Q83_11470 [Alphaproteobacteria bacterium 46_93_T64]|nr:hypothetical protein A9Q83_11470 [Alphaproteobacteria bacterium 46_93_T64]
MKKFCDGPFIAADYLPRPIGCASVDVGVGKTDAAVGIISQLLKQSIVCKHRDEQSELKAIYAVPTHKLGQELVQRFVARDVTAGVWRGRLADNPEKPGEKMCLKPAEVEEVSERGLPIQRSMCRVKVDDIHYTCEHFQDCPYQMQADLLSQVDVVIVTHASLFYEMPSIGRRQILVIDEAFWSAGLRGV